MRRWRAEGLGRQTWERKIKYRYSKKFYYGWKKRWNDEEVAQA